MATTNKAIPIQTIGSPSIGNVLGRSNGSNRPFSELGNITTGDPRAGKNRGSQSNISKKGNTKKSTNTDPTIDKEIVNLWVRNCKSGQIVQDKYSIQTADAINAGTDTSGSFSNTFNINLVSGPEAVAGILAKVKAAVGIANQVKGVFSGNGTLLDKLKSMGGLTTSACSSLNIPQGSDLYNKLNAASNIVVTVAGTARNLKDADWSNLSTVGNILNQYTKDNELFKIKDLGAEGAFAASLINECTKNNIPNSFPKIAETLGDKTTIMNILGDILPGMVSSADMKNIKDIVDFVGSSEIKSLFPGLVDSLSKNYKKNYFDGGDTASGRYKLVNEVLDKVDDNWYQTSREDDTILSVEKIINGSDDFIDMYALGTQINVDTLGDKKLLAIVSKFKPTSVMDEIKKYFPNTMVAMNTVTVNQGNEDLLL